MFMLAACWGYYISMQVFFTSLPGLMQPVGLDFQISFTDTHIHLLGETCYFHPFLSVGS